MTYKVRIWCYDCCGEDFYGCFDGGSEVLDETFDTVEAAADAGAEATKDVGPWCWQVERDGEVCDWLLPCAGPDGETL